MSDETRGRILLVEDDEAGRELGRFNLGRAGFEVDVAGDGREGLRLLASGTYDLVVTDLRMPGASGMELLEAARARSPEMPVIVVTAYGNVERAVEAMKAGARDFIGKPFNRDHLLLAVDKALEARDLRREVRELRIRSRGVERPVVHLSRAMTELLERTDRVAASESTVLVTGESGTGKELVARRLHARSRRGEGPFVAVSCAAIPTELLESELFGHRRGAFTGASRDRTGRFRAAEGGTLFLDEVAELPGEVQAKLLRVLQERLVEVVGADEPVPVDVRVVAATNRELGALVAEGRFRADLYYRLAVVELEVPPLRDRPEDVPALVEHFVAVHGMGRELSVPAEVVAELRARPWPGNVRELENACERMVVLATGDELSVSDLPPARGRAAAAGPEEWPPLPEDGLSLVELERRVVERALERQGWNVSKTARYLRVPRHVLSYRMEKHGIRRPG